MWDLVVAGGDLIIPEYGQLSADVAVRGGKVAAIGNDLGPGERTVDARGAVVLPGLVDPHVHLALENSFADDARTETASALAAGVTTVGLYLRELEQSYVGVLPGLREDWENGAYVDAFFSLQIFNEEQLAGLQDYLRFGISSFKLYMYGLPGVVPSVNDAFILEAMGRIAQATTGGVVSVHCENEPMVEAAIARLERERPEGTLEDWAESHPAEAEAEAIGRAAFLAEQAGCTLYIVHLSSKIGLKATKHALKWYDRIVVETTSPILGVDMKDPNGFLAKMSPPLRSPEDREALWTALADGTIDTVGTDNTSRSRAAKNVDRGLHGARTGYPALGTHLTALLEEGYHRRGVSLQRIAQVACQRPAEVFGLYPRKGTIVVGGDADLVVVDLFAERVVDAEHLHSFSDFSIFEGRSMRGWPRAVIKGGDVAMEDNTILVPPGNGRYLLRSLTG